MTAAVTQGPPRHGKTQAGVSLPDVGLGTHRTAGTYIGALLQLEGQDAVDVLVDAAKTLNITLEEITHAWHAEPCPTCGVTLLNVGDIAVCDTGCDQPEQAHAR